MENKVSEVKLSLLDSHKVSLQNALVSLIELLSLSRNDFSYQEGGQIVNSKKVDVSMYISNLHTNTIAEILQKTLDGLEQFKPQSDSKTVDGRKVLNINSLVVKDLDYDGGEILLSMIIDLDIK